MPTGKRVTESQIETIRRMSEEGYPQKKIVCETGLSRFAVARHQKKLGYSGRTHLPKEELRTLMYEREPEAITVYGEGQDKPSSGKWIIWVYRIIRIRGAGTRFEYTLDMLEGIVTITTRSNGRIVLDFIDLAPFGNELLSISKQVFDMTRRKT